jgi:hypothetical protein
MLYDPQMSSASIEQVCLSETYWNFSVSAQMAKLDFRASIHQRTINHPLHLPLSEFGNVVPTQESRVTDDAAFTFINDWILEPFVCFRTIRKFARIEVE